MYLTGKNFLNLISEIGEGIEKKILYNTVLRNKNNIKWEIAWQFYANLDWL